MPRFAANLSFMFGDLAFLDRFAAAADAGFAAVEYLFPYEHAPDVIANALQRHGLTQALFNLPPGDWAAGDRGLAAIPARADERRAGTVTALRYAEATGVKRVHLMAGLADPADERAIAAYRDAVVETAETLGAHGLDLVLEPINARDMQGYFLSRFEQAERLIDELALTNLGLQFDIYHRQIMHGDVTMALRRMIAIVKHVQVASVPTRHEPDGEELNYPFLFDELDRLGYQGYVGCEYRPRAATIDGLGWFAPYRRRAA